MPGIVVGVDQSAQSHEALDWAMREAALRGADLIIVAVVPAEASPWTRRPLSVPNADQAIAQARQTAEDAAAKAADALGDKQPASVTVQAFAGYPAQALVDASRDAELVVVGSRGSGGVGELLLGSVPSQVAHHAACPVVIVRAVRPTR